MHPSQWPVTRSAAIHCRREDANLITGAAGFVGDLRPRAVTYAPLGRTRAFCAWIQALPALLENAAAQRLPRPMLAHDVARFVGEPFAIVVAETPQLGPLNKLSLISRICPLSFPSQRLRSRIVAVVQLRKRTCFEQGRSESGHRTSSLRWLQACEASQIDRGYYARRGRPRDEPARERRLGRPACTHDQQNGVPRSAAALNRRRASSIARSGPKNTALCSASTAASPRNSDPFSGGHARPRGRWPFTAVYMARPED